MFADPPPLALAFPVRFAIPDPTTPLFALLPDPLAIAGPVRFAAATPPGPLLPLPPGNAAHTPVPTAATPASAVTAASTWLATPEETNTNVTASPPTTRTVTNTIQRRAVMLPL